MAERDLITEVRALLTSEFRAALFPTGLDLAADVWARITGAALIAELANATLLFGSADPTASNVVSGERKLYANTTANTLHFNDGQSNTWTLLGGGVSLDDVNNRIAALVKDYALTGGGQVTESDIPSEIARDSEVTNSVNSAVSTAVANQVPGLVSSGIAAALAAAVIGNTETGITVTYADGKYNFVVTATGGGTPTPVADDLYFGTSSDAVPQSAELTIEGMNGSGTIAAYAGHRHHLIARLASEGDITSVLYSDDPTMVNTLGAFTKYSATVMPPSESGDFSVWVTNQALLQTADVIVTVG